MSRNKNPQETIDKILNAAARLFADKGYENTSIRDIQDQLGGLTKGAIFHHFKSKEEIIHAVLDRQFEQYDAGWMKLLQENKELSGLQKLREMFLASLKSPWQSEKYQQAPNLLDSPMMLAMQLKSIKEEAAVEWIEPIIKEGIADGSIQTEFPKELAEVILLLLNIWVTPAVFTGDREEIQQRVVFFRHLTKELGVDFVNEEFAEGIVNLTEMYQHK